MKFDNLTVTVESSTDHVRSQTSERNRKYRAIHGKEINSKRWGQIPEFIGVDSEGIGKGKAHRTVLVSVGDNSYIAKDQSAGLHWTEVFDFLWENYLDHKRAAFVGFSLGYDFNRWLMSLLREKAWMLLTDEGKYKRIPKTRMGRFTKYPVRIPAVTKYTNYGWEVEMLAFKALTIRPMVCDCYMRETWVKKCPHRKALASQGKLTLCDTFAFFGESFLNVVNPGNWKKEPMGPPVTDDEYAIIKKGKEFRPDAIEVDAEMIMYNVTENKALAAVMTRLASGLIDIGIHLKKDEWYGPGATAAAWLRMKGILKKDELIAQYPELEDILPIFEKSYYGGWFEIFSHGIIPGYSFNYDINNAYPFAISQLPVMSGIWRRGNNDEIPEDDQRFILCYGKFTSAGNRIGCLPHRRKDGSIIRPKITVGWYWLHEINAAASAGILEDCEIQEWIQFLPESEEKPLAEIEEMYYERLRFGKKSAKGLAIKLTNNSDYGKFAQTVGAAPYNNWFYASYITSYCRTQILNAIATHPGMDDAVLMVATDGIIFDSPHIAIEEEIERFATENPIDLNGNPRIIDKASGEDKRDDRLGYWERKIYHNLHIFKPGVYWDKDGMKKIGNMKSRGINPKHFAESVLDAEIIFQEWQDQKSFNLNLELLDFAPVYADGKPVEIFDNGWPQIRTDIEFSFVSCMQALQGSEDNWQKAGEVKEPWRIVQSSNPTIDDGKKGKRQNPHWNHQMNRMDTDYITEENVISTPYGETSIPSDDFSDDYYTQDGELVAELGMFFRAMHGDDALESVARHSEY